MSGYDKTFICLVVGNWSPKDSRLEEFSCEGE